MAFVSSRVLLAYDDSAGSRIALQYACALAGNGAALAVAHACKENNFVASAAIAGSLPAVDPTAMIAAVDEQSDVVLKAAVAACAAQGIRAEKIFVHDSPADGMIAVARKTHAELIVVGTHGRKGVARNVQGSVSERILRASDVPVLIVTRHAKPPQRERTFSRALVAVDDSESSKTALTFAARLAGQLGTRLTLCSVVDLNALERTSDGTYSFEPGMHAAAINLSQRAKATVGIAPFLDDEVVVKGEPATAIEHTAMQRNCDLIVVGSHHRHGLRRALEGSVAETLARDSAIPVVVVPAGQRA
jgi:nucleotide-binding universal stress UspA family protein